MFAVIHRKFENIELTILVIFDKLKRLWIMTTYEKILRTVFPNVRSIND